jgi:5-methylcytosine-specific restriction endonuclease McrA
MDTTNLPKTRSEAKATGAKYYFTGEPCKHGHITARKTKGACVDCMKLEWAESAVKRADYFKEYNKIEVVKDRKHEWYQENKEQVIAAAKTRPASARKEYQKTWKDKNLVWVRADTKARRRKHRDASPFWLTTKQKSEIRSLYQIAITMTKVTGEQYVVDHIWPLRNDVVCGLHVPWNLQVITRRENLAKSNILPDDSMALAFPQSL